jgi:hypothetical protein
MVVAGGIAAKARAFPEKKSVAPEEGGYVTAIAVDPADPHRVYVATARGSFASTDAGLHWAPLATAEEGGFVAATAEEGGFVAALAIEPGPLASLFAGTNGGSLLRQARHERRGLPDGRWRRAVDERAARSRRHAPRPGAAPGASPASGDPGRESGVPAGR